MSIPYMFHDYSIYFTWLFHDFCISVYMIIPYYVMINYSIYFTWWFHDYSIYIWSYVYIYIIYIYKSQLAHDLPSEFCIPPRAAARCHRCPYRARSPRDWSLRRPSRQPGPEDCRGAVGEHLGQNKNGSWRWVKYGINMGSSWDNDGKKPLDIYIYIIYIYMRKPWDHDGMMMGRSLDIC